MSLSNKDSNIYDELTELEESNSGLREKLASREYEVLMLTQTVSLLQDDMIKTFNDSKLEVMVLQKKLDGRILQ